MPLQDSRAFLDLGLHFAGNGLDYWMTILLSLRVRYLSSCDLPGTRFTQYHTHGLACPVSTRCIVVAQTQPPIGVTRSLEQHARFHGNA